MIIRITVVAGPFEGSAYEGPIEKAPIFALVPSNLQPSMHHAKAVTMRTRLVQLMSEFQDVSFSTSEFSIRVSRVNS